MDETETDVDILLECLRYQNTDYQAVKRSLQALAAVFNSDGNSKEYFRKVGGLQLTQRLLSADFPDDVLQAAVFCLACAVEDDVFCQHSTTKMETFEFLHSVLSEKRRDRKWLQAAAYLVVNLVANNSAGQQLAKESCVLADLLSVFRQFAKRKRVGELGPDEVDFCVSVVIALSMCVNNPQNEANQRLCCTILPLCFHVIVEDTWSPLTGSLLSFAGLTVAGNGFNQKRMKSCGGLDTLLELLEGCERQVKQQTTTTTSSSSLPILLVPAVISVINACISDCQENAQYFVEKGGVEKIVTWLGGPHQLSPHHLLQLMLTLGYALEYADKTVAPLMHQHQTLLVKLLTEADDEELVRAIKYVLSAWQHLDDGKQVSCNKQKEGDTNTQRIDCLARQIYQGSECKHDRMDQDKDEQTVRDERQGTDKENTADQCQQVRTNQQEAAAERSDYKVDHCGWETMERNEMVAQGSRQVVQGQDLMALDGCPIEGAPVVNPDRPHPVTVASTRLPQEDAGAARQTDTRLPSQNDRYDIRQTGSAPVAATQAPAPFFPGSDINAIRHTGFDHRSADIAPQDSSFLTAYMPVPADARSGMREGGDPGLHEQQAYVQKSFFQQPFSSFSALPVSNTSASLPQLAAAASRSCQMLLHRPPQTTPAAAVGLSQAQHPVPIFSTYPSVAGNCHPILSQQAHRPSLPQPFSPHQPLNMPTINGSMTFHHQQPCTGLPVTYPYTQRSAVSEVQHNAMALNPQCPFPASQLVQGVQVTQPFVSSSQAARLPSFYFTKAPASLPSSGGQPPTGVSDPPQSSVGQGGRGQMEHLLSVSRIPSTSLSQLRPYPYLSPPPPYPPTSSGQPAVVEQRSSQFPLAPLTSGQLPAAPSSSAAESTGLVTVNSTAVPPAMLSGEDSQQQSLSTGHLWRQVMPTVWAERSNFMHSMSYLPSTQTASSSEWCENRDTPTLSNCYSESDQRYIASQGQHPPTVMHSQSGPAMFNQSDPSSAIRPSQTPHSGEPAQASSALAPQSTTARPMPPHTSVFQQQSCLTSIHGSHSSVACPGDRGMTSSGEDGAALSSTLSHFRAAEARNQTAAACPASGSLRAGVQQSPPLITDTCQVTVEQDHESAQAAETIHNDSCKSTCLRSSEQNPSSQSRHVFTKTKPSNKKGPDRTLSADTLLKVLDKRESAHSAHTPSHSGDYAADLMHTQQDRVFRVPFPKPAGSRSSLQSDSKASPCISSAVKKSPPLSALSVRRKGLRRAPSKTPDIHQSVLVTAPTPNKHSVSEEVARHLSPSSKGDDGERAETRHNAFAEQTLGSCRERQPAFSTQQTENLRPAMAAVSHGIPSSPAASEFDFQLLKTAARGIQTSQARYSNGQKPYDLSTKKPRRMWENLSSLQERSRPQPEKGPRVHSAGDMGSLEDLDLRSGRDEEYANNELVPDSEDCDSEDDERHILHNFSQQTLSPSEDDSLSDISSCLSTVYSMTRTGVLSFRAAVKSGTDVAEVCPGCSSQQDLSSRSFNIAIETSSVTCRAHRRIRQLERDFIWKRAYRGQTRKRLGHQNKSGHPNKMGHKKKTGHLPWRKRVKGAASLTAKTGQGQPRNVRVTKGSSCYDNRNGGVREGKTVVVNSDRKQVQQCTPPRGSHRPLSMCEERRLRRAVARMGQDWTAILHSGHFARGRTAEELRAQWALLCHKIRARREEERVLE